MFLSFSQLDYDGKDNSSVTTCIHTTNWNLEENYNAQHPINKDLRHTIHLLVENGTMIDQYLALHLGSERWIYSLLMLVVGLHQP